MGSATGSVRSPRQRCRRVVVSSMEGALGRGSSFSLTRGRAKRLWLGDKPIGGNALAARRSDKSVRGCVLRLPPRPTTPWRRAGPSGAARVQVPSRRQPKLETRRQTRCHSGSYFVLSRFAWAGWCGASRASPSAAPYRACRVLSGSFTARVVKLESRTFCGCSCANVGGCRSR